MLVCCYAAILGPHLGAILKVVGLVLAPCWGQVGAILDHLGTSAGSGWAGGDTRSAKNSLGKLKIPEILGGDPRRGLDDFEPGVDLSMETKLIETP